MAAAFAVACLALSGCGQGQELTQSPSSVATTNSTEVAAESVLEPRNEEWARQVMLESYYRFESEGMTETVFSEGETWKLVMDPTQADYQAALFNLDTLERQLIFETDYFTLFVGYLMLESTGSDFVPSDQGFIASADDFNSIEFFVEGNSVSGAQGLDQEWVASFDYSVDPELRDGLIQLADELIASFGSD